MTYYPPIDGNIAGAAIAGVQSSMIFHPLASDHPPLQRLTTIPALDSATDGIVRGSVVLMGGAPGAGKSTLLLQMVAAVPNACYVTSEETCGAVARRAARIGVQHAEAWLAEADEVSIIGAALMARRPPLAVIDSLQTTHTTRCKAALGTPSQMRATAAALTEMTRKSDMALIIVCHETKAGGFTGPRTIEHLVDVVLRLHRAPRALVAIKNRYGPADVEVRLRMTESGMAIDDEPAAAAITDRAAYVLQAIGRAS